jgi:hypothetical protein
MRGTFGAFRRHTRIAVALIATTLVLSSADAGASSPRVNLPAEVLPLCGIVKNPSVRVSSTDGCVVRILLGANAQFKLSGNFRWGNPVSSSRDVVVRSITHNSIGVDGATLHAAKVGRATVQVTGVEACKVGVACPDLALLQRLNVIVVRSFTS